MTRCNLRLDPNDMSPEVASAAAASNVNILVLLFWYVSWHICQTLHYRDFVFTKGRVPGGGFPEDSLGQGMHAEIWAAAQDGRWREAHSAYGTYIYDADGEGPMVGHLRGRRYIDAADLRSQGWNGHLISSASPYLPNPQS